MLLKKRILPLALSAIMAVSALTGCVRVDRLWQQFRERQLIRD